MSWKCMIWAHKLRVGLSASEYRHLMVLAEHANEDGTEARPSVETVARESESSERNVQYSLRSLVERGIIEAQRAAGRHSPVCWRLNIDLEINAKVSTPHDSRGANHDEEGRKKSHSGVQSKTKRGAPGAPEPVLEPIQGEPVQQTILVTPHGATEGVSASQTSVSKKEFESIFWPRYPRKVAKDAALKAFLSARRRATLEDIMAGLERYHPKPDFIAHAATWLHQGRWQDEPDAAPAPYTVTHQSHQNAQGDPSDPYGAEAWAEARGFDLEPSNGQMVRVVAAAGIDAVAVAVECCEAMGLDPSERPDLSIVEQWLRAGLDPGETIRKRWKPGIRSLKWFDAAVREHALPDMPLMYDHESGTFVPRRPS